MDWGGEEAKVHEESDWATSMEDDGGEIVSVLIGWKNKMRKSDWLYV